MRPVCCHSLRGAENSQIHCTPVEKRSNMPLRARQQLESAIGPALPLPCRAPWNRKDLRDKGANPDFEFRMRLIIKRLSLLLALAFSVSANAAPGVAQAPAPAAAKLPGAAPVEVVSVEGITEYRLPNGLRVLRDISPALLASVRAAGFDYVYRRWQRHDGTEVACAREAARNAAPSERSCVASRDVNGRSAAPTAHRGRVSSANRR